MGVPSLSAVPISVALAVLVDFRIDELLPG